MTDLNNEDQDDIQLLATSLYELLSGEMKIGTHMLKLGKAIGRQKERRAVWLSEGFSRWINENEDAVPVLAGALGESGIEKLKAWLDQQTAS